MVSIVTVKIRGLTEIAWDYVDWIKLAGDMVQWLAVRKKIWKFADYFLIIWIIEFSRTKKLLQICVQKALQNILSHCVKLIKNVRLVSDFRLHENTVCFLSW